MTCIVGLRHQGKTYIGGDAAGVDSTGTVDTRTAKIFIRDDYVIGYAGSFRFGDILQFRMMMPDPKPARVSLREHLVIGWIDYLRQLLKDQGFISNGDKECEGHFLIGYKGDLCIIAEDFQVGNPKEGYSAIGSGTDYALGALYATKRLKISPINRVRIALKAAAHHNAFVRPPFTILVS